jgi:hypothetical protein
MTTTGYVLSGLIGVGIIFIGLRFLYSPEVAGRDYGVPASPTPGVGLNSFLAAKGMRDIVSGLFTFLLMANGKPALLGEFLLIASLIAFGDAIIVLRAGGKRATVFGVHGGAGLFMVATGAILIAAAK